MKNIYTVKGILNKGFVGQISYTICLDKEYKEMDLCFSFDKQRFTTFTIAITNKPGYTHFEADPYYVVLRTKKGTYTKKISANVPLIVDCNIFEQETIILPKLY